MTHSAPGDIARVAHKELRERFRDRWFVLALAVMAFLGVAAALSGAAAADTRARINASAQAGDYARWLAQPERDAHSASHFGTSAFYVPSRLSSLDPGAVPYVGASLFLEAHKQNEPVFAEAPDGGAVQRLGRMSLATVIQVWLPLIVIAAAAGAFAAEREAGTLALLLSLGVSPARLLAGKALAAGVAALAVVGPGAAVGVALLGRVAGAWPADVVERSALLAVAWGLYLVFWVVITLAVSLRAPNVRLAMAALLTVWCLGVVVAPRVAADLARVAHPLPSRAELDRLEIERRIQTPGSYEKLRQQILIDYGVATPADLPVDINVIYAQRAEARINQRLDERMAELWAIYQGERRDYQRASAVSPAVALDLVSMAAAGSDDVHHRSFLRQAEDYRRQMMAVLGEAERRKPGAKRNRGNADVWRRLPPFEYRVPPLRLAETSAASALATLGAWCLAAIGAAVVALRTAAPR
jgi:ABC-2 type transport system permease protein